MRSRTWTIAGLLFGSGFCALVYQIAWLREFRLIFGASTAASAAVLAIFIGGLGLGGWLLGPRADRHPRPLLYYANLEAIVAISAAVSPFLLELVRTAYFASGGTFRLGFTVGTIGRLALSALVLAIPTLAMGGTLPAAARAATRISDDRRQDLAALYALNTLGAVAGCTVATFVLLEIYGTRSTLWLAALANVLVAMVARSLERSQAESRRPDASRSADWSDGARGNDRLHEVVGSGRALASGAEVKIDWASRLSDGRPNPRDLHDPRDARDPLDPLDLRDQLGVLPPVAPSNPPAFVLLASATVGFAFFLMELVWYRLLAPLLGGSVFTFGLVLAVALVGIGLGGLLYAVTSRGRPATLAGFSATCLLEAIAVAGTFALGDRLAILAAVMMPMRAGGFAATVLGWTFITGIVVLPPAFISGYQFPMLIALLGRGRDALGRQIGLAYAANTVGAIVGSLAGGFGILPWLSAPGAWRLVAVVLLALGAAAALLAARETRWVRLVPHAVGAVLALVLVNATGPTAVWRHSGIGAGRVPDSALSSANQLRAWRNSMNQWVHWDGDGVESSVAMALDATGYAFLVNGKSDGATRGDAGTQVMLGLIGALRVPEAKTAMVVGLGTGSSAGWLAAVPGMERVDAVELEPLVLDVARQSTAVNHDALANPKLHVMIGDAREALLTTRNQYDIIASEPSNPFRAGIASLFTREFYEAANARLTPDGVIAQWVQGYEIDAPTLRTIYATLATVFPQVEAWQTHGGDLVLLGAKRPRPYSARALTARLAQEPFKSALAHVWRGTDINALLAHYVAADGVARTFVSSPNVAINTDDRNTVEFGFARSVGVPRALMVPELRRLASLTGFNRPTMSDEDGVDWAAVETARVSYNASEARFEDLPVTGSPSELSRQLALVRFYQSNDVAGARAAWPPQAEPRDLIETRMLAGMAAESASELAMPWIERIRAHEPGEADALVATLRYRQGRFADAAAALVASFVAFRTDPWATQHSMQRALALVEPIVSRDPSTARALFESLRQPFVVRALDSARLISAGQLTRRLEFGALCGETIRSFEPYPPWNEFYLTFRRDCYREARALQQQVVAQRELDDFLRHEPAPLAR